MFANIEQSKEDKREPGKVRVVSSGLEARVEALEETVVNLTKLALQNKQAIRQIKGAQDRNWLVPDNSLIFLSAKKGITSFQELKKAMLEKKKTNQEIKDALGSPHIHALLKVFRAFVDSELGTKEERKQMADNLDKWTDWRLMQVHIPHFRAARTNKSSTKRIEVTVPQSPLMQFNPIPDHLKDSPTHMWELIATHMLKEGQELPGTAPRNDLERRLQLTLDEHKESQGDD